MRIVDESGGPVRLVAVDIQGMGQGSGLPDDPALPESKGWSTPSEQTYENIASWGFNAVRLPIAWANIEPSPPDVGSDGSLTHHYDTGYLAALDGIISNFGRRGIAVVLCMCQRKWSPAFEIAGAGGTVTTGSGMPAWLYPADVYKQIYRAKHDFFAPDSRSLAGFLDAWKLIAGRYADDPTVVGVDMINEPYYGTDWLPTAADLHLDLFYRRVGAAIRSANPRVLLVFEDSQNKGDGLFALQAPPPFPNVVYSFHLYTDDWQPQGLAETETFWSRAERWNVPLWIGEFNRFGNTEAGTIPLSPNWQEQLTDMLAFVRDRGIGWAYWAYHGRDALGSPKDGVADPSLLATLQAGF